MANNPDQELAAETFQKHPGGRPTDYKPEYAEQARKMCLLGATDYELADFFDVNTATIYRWKNTHPEFCKAVIIGKEAADDRVERAFFNRAVGYSFESEKVFNSSGTVLRAPTVEHVPPDPGAALSWLKNRRGDKWRDKHDHTLSGPDGGPVKYSKIELVAPSLDDIATN